jgi:hypothetical protein
VGPFEKEDASAKHARMSVTLQYTAGPSWQASASLSGLTAPAATRHRSRALLEDESSHCAYSDGVTLVQSHVDKVYKGLRREARGGDFGRDVRRYPQRAKLIVRDVGASETGIAAKLARCDLNEERDSHIAVQPHPDGSEKVAHLLQATGAIALLLSAVVIGHR